MNCLACLNSFTPSPHTYYETKNFICDIYVLQVPQATSAAAKDALASDPVATCYNFTKGASRSVRGVIASSALIDNLARY